MIDKFATFLLIMIYFISCNHSANKNKYELIESYAYLNKSNIIVLHELNSKDEIEIKYVIWNREKNNPELVTLIAPQNYFNLENFGNFTTLKSERGNYLINPSDIHTIIDLGEQTQIFFKLSRERMISEIMPLFEIAGIDTLDYFNKDFIVGSILTSETLTEITSKIDTNNIKIIKTSGD